MARVFRLFRLWEKKRGERRTGSPLVGGLGEAVFFATLFMLGCASLAYIATSRVLAREVEVFTPGMGHWLLVLVFASFVLIGGGGLAFAVLHMGTSVERRSALTRRAATLPLLGGGSPAARDFPAIPGDANLTNSPGIRLTYRLPVSHTQAWRLLAATAFCGVWNSMTVALVTVAMERHVADRPSWVLTALTFPFLAIGGWAIYDFVQQVWMLTGIGPTSVEISDHPLFPGREYQVFVSQAGRLEMLAWEVALVCDEEATYLQGTDVRVETRRVFHKRLYYQEGFPIEPRKPFEVQFPFAVPERCMHSFQSGHNTVLWKLVVTGTARLWPTFERVFPVVVYPRIPG